MVIPKQLTGLGEDSTAYTDYPLHVTITIDVVIAWYDWAERPWQVTAKHLVGERRSPLPQCPMPPCCGPPYMCLPPSPATPLPMPQGDALRGVRIAGGGRLQRGGAGHHHSPDRGVPPKRARATPVPTRLSPSTPTLPATRCHIEPIQWFGRPSGGLYRVATRVARELDETRHLPQMQDAGLALRALRMGALLHATAHTFRPSPGSCKFYPCPSSVVTQRGPLWSAASPSPIPGSFCPLLPCSLLPGPTPGLVAEVLLGKSPQNPAGQHLKIPAACCAVAVHRMPPHAPKPEGAACAWPKHRGPHRDNEGSQLGTRCPSPIPTTPGRRSGSAGPSPQSPLE